VCSVAGTAAIVKPRVDVNVADAAAAVYVIIRRPCSDITD